MKYILSGLFLFFASVNNCQLSAQVIQNQVIPGELPDPSIIEVNGTYYVTGSSNDWGSIYPIYKSTDLKNWIFVNFVFKNKPDWTISSYWAPELMYQNGTFYCYYTAKRKDGTSLIGVATSKDLLKGFNDHGQLLEWGDEAIDAFVYKEYDKLFITWKAYGLTENKPIQILGAELSANGLSVTGEAFEILTANADSWEKGGIEGQCIIKNGDYLYMLYSGNACCGLSCDYQVGVARSKTIYGPWEKYSSNSILKGNDTWKCPGHGTALKTNNKWYYLYHAYPSKGFPYLGRSAILSELNWDTEKGWPSFKIDSLRLKGKFKKTDLTDNFDSAKLGSWWRYDIPNSIISTNIKDNKLTLTENAHNEENNSGSILVIDPQGANFTISTRITENNNALKGLTVYATKDNSIGLGIKRDSLILWKVKNGDFTKLNTIHLNKSGDIFLRGHITDAHIAKFYYSYNGKEWDVIENKKENSLLVKGDNLAWWSWGIKAGLFVKTDIETFDKQAEFSKFSIKYD
ncbi:MAG: family 43 glycosylhydrolase [Leeuwenhoekiella sp.]